MVRFLSALVVLVGIFVGEADGTTSTIRFAERFAEQYPDPTGEESICQNELNEGDKRRRVMVCDVDSVLGGNKDSHAHSLKLLDEAIRKIEDVKLSVCDGVGTDSVEVAIVLMNEMHHIPLVERPSPSSEDYGAFLSSTAGELASAIHNKYGVGRQAETCGHGHKETHTGLLIFASVKDRVIHFSTTDGAAAYITPWRISSLSRACKRGFVAKDYTQGLLDVLSDVETYFQNRPNRFQRFFFFIVDNILTIVFSLWIIYLITSHLKKKRETMEYENCKTQLDRLELERAQVLQGKFKCSSCPICLEEFQRDDGNESDQNFTRGSDGEELMLLRCGHTFDKSCLQKYIKSAKTKTPTCPICREQINPPQKNTKHQTSTTTMTRENYQPEFNFRLNRLSRRYPDYITRDIVNRWSGGDGVLANSSSSSISEDAAFASLRPVHSNSASSSGSSSFSGSSYSSYSGRSSFGGGRSSGGGGGRW